MLMRCARLGLLLCLAASAARAGELENQMLAAARRGDAEAVKAAIAQGADVNARFRYGTTALFPACDKGHIEVVRVLLEHGANVNLKDSFYGATPLTWAAMNSRTEIIGLLLEKGAEGGGDVLIQAIMRGSTEVARAVLEKAKLKPQDLSSALVNARQRNRTEIIELLLKAGAEPPKEGPAVAPEILQRYAGTFRDEVLELTFAVKDGKLTATQGGQSFTLRAVNQTTFEVNEVAATVIFPAEGEKSMTVTVKQSGGERILKRVEGKP